MKNSYEVRAQKFIQMLYPYIYNCRTYRDYERAVVAFNITYGRKVQMFHGATRISFVTSDYVVKINFEREDYSLDRFGGCEEEIEVYEKAKKDGFEYLFAKIIRYHYHINFYIMPRVYNIGKYDDDAYYHVSDEEFEWLYEHVADLHCGNYGWKNGKIIIFDYAADIDK